MAQRIYLVHDGDTTQVVRSAWPTSKTEVRRYALPLDKQAVEVQLIVDDGATGDTLSWGFKAARAFGVVVPAEKDF